MVTPEFWKGKRVFLTGHTGFKGSWLSLWLHRMGAEVFGYALAPPSDPSLYELARIDELVQSTIADVREPARLERAMGDARPDIVIHMAAQSLVRHSYAEPVETFGTNVMGTVNVLDAMRRCTGIRAAVIVTSDKCYRNEEWVWGYREDDRLGGMDPYSGSKGAAELVVTAYRHSYFAGEPATGLPAIASARAGNVIGGGDWAADRLVPDILRSLLRNEPTLIRNPQATRPWQHVLEPLNGYLLLAERLHDQGEPFAGAWNLGPSEQSERTVGWIIDWLYALWGADFEWIRDRDPGPPESTFLKLDASTARAHLGGRPGLALPPALEWSVDGTRRYQAGNDMRTATQDQIERFTTMRPAD